MHGFYILVAVTCISRVSGYFWIEEGGPCTKRNGERGICTHFSKCQSAIREVRRNGRPEICSFAGLYPIVCCPNSQNIPGNFYSKENDNVSYYLPFDENNISLKKCRQYHSKNKDENTKYMRRDSKIKQYPHIAILGFPSNDQVIWTCAGTLISEKFVLTSAHCLHSRLYGELKYIRLGELDLKVADDDSQPQDFTVKHVYIHDAYEPSSGYHDIALVELNRPAKITEYVRPACLALTEDLNGTLPELTGFGLIREDHSDKKLETSYYEYVSNEYCNKAYGTPNFIKLGIKHTQICGKTEDTCVDSGGPLQITNFFYEFGNFPEIVGISSFGRVCGKSPDVFTRIYSYAPWIARIVWSR